MDEKHPNQSGNRPKRRRDKYNPYEIYVIGRDTDDPQYFISFIDALGEQQILKIEEDLFKVFDRFELEDLSYLHKVDNHYERSKLTESSLYDRAFQKPTGVEDIAIRRVVLDRIFYAISLLTESQRRRLLMYYFDDLTYEQIAKQEGCTIMPVKRSVDTAIGKIKKDNHQEG